MPSSRPSAWPKPRRTRPQWRTGPGRGRPSPHLPPLQWSPSPRRGRPKARRPRRPGLSAGWRPRGYTRPRPVGWRSTSPRTIPHPARPHQLLAGARRPRPLPARSATPPEKLPKPRGPLPAQGRMPARVSRQAPITSAPEDAGEAPAALGQGSPQRGRRAGSETVARRQVEIETGVRPPLRQPAGRTVRQPLQRSRPATAEPGTVVRPRSRRQRRRGRRAPPRACRALQVPR